MSAPPVDRCDTGRRLFVCPPPFIGGPPVGIAPLLPSSAPRGSPRVNHPFSPRCLLPRPLPPPLVSRGVFTPPILGVLPCVYNPGGFFRKGNCFSQDQRSRKKFLGGPQIILSPRIPKAPLGPLFSEAFPGVKAFPPPFFGGQNPCKPLGFSSKPRALVKIPPFRLCPP